MQLSWTLKSAPVVGFVPSFPPFPQQDTPALAGYAAPILQGIQVYFASKGQAQVHAPNIRSAELRTPAGRDSARGCRSASWSRRDGRATPVLSGCRGRPRAGGWRTNASGCEGWRV